MVWLDLLYLQCALTHNCLSDHFVTKCLFRPSGIVSLMSVMDFVDKNREKLLEPKGRGGPSGGYSGMY